jgi:polysaccharide export outer membrane protein
MRIRGFGELMGDRADRTVEVMDHEVTREERRPPKSPEIARRSPDHERGRIIMSLYKPIVASVVMSLMIAGFAAAQDPAKRAPAAAAAPANAAPTHAAPAGGAPVSADYKIGVDDVLDIAVWNNTTVSRTVPVRPDGKISLPLLNEVQAAGLTPSQLRTSLMSKLVEYMPTPEVSVIVREVHSNKISVLGEVRRAGRFEISQRATVLDAVALAGGFNDFARRTKLVIVRQEASGTKRIPINYNRIVADEDDNVILQPGDIVVVP